MSEKQLVALMNWVDALIDLKLADDHGRNASSEWLRKNRLQEELEKAFFKGERQWLGTHTQT